MTVEHWDTEAVNDPRYAAGIWGMGLEGRGDPIGTVAKIVGHLEEHLPDNATRVLEIGCGPGRILFPFAIGHPHVEFLGTDFSPRMIRYASDRRPEVARAFRCANVYLYKTSTLDIFEPDDDEPFPWEMKFDLIYAVELFQHLDDVAMLRYLTEARSLLRPSGTMWFQYVNNGRPAEPHSYPRTNDQVAGLMMDAGYECFGIGPLDDLHPEWRYCDGNP